MSDCSASALAGNISSSDWNWNGLGFYTIRTMIAQHPGSLLYSESTEHMTSVTIIGPRHFARGAQSQ